jgi:hypothetical protein
MRWFPSATLFFLLLVASSPGLAQNGKIDPLPALADKSVSEAIRQALEAKGYRVLLDDGTNACEIWLRKAIPAQPKKDAQGVAYPEIAESTLVGVLHFSQASTDYRGQAVPAGYYTLRYALLPNDGNHLGVAPSRDFLLLIPADTDADPASTFPYQELVNLSLKATGTKHPAPLSLVQPDSSGTAPAVSNDDQDHWTFSAGLKLASGEEIPFALVVKGAAQQ